MTFEQRPSVHNGYHHCGVPKLVVVHRFDYCAVQMWFFLFQVPIIVDAIAHPPPYKYIWVINPDATTQTLHGQDGDTIVLTRLSLKMSLFVCIQTLALQRTGGKSQNDPVGSFNPTLRICYRPIVKDSKSYQINFGKKCRTELSWIRGPR